MAYRMQDSTSGIYSIILCLLLTSGLAISCCCTCATSCRHTLSSTLVPCSRIARRKHCVSCLGSWKGGGGSPIYRSLGSQRCVCIVYICHPWMYMHIPRAHVNVILLCACVNERMHACTQARRPAGPQACRHAGTHARTHACMHTIPYPN